MWSGKFGPPIWDPGDFGKAEYLHLAAKGELIGGFDEAGMAVCMLLQFADSIFWPDDHHGEAIYLHKIAVHRRAAGRGWPGAMIEYAVHRAYDEGAMSIRIDTVPIPRMISLYQGLGFVLIDREARLFGERMLVRLERAI